MRPVIVALVEAVRGLHVHLKPTPANPRAIRIGLDMENFKNALYEVAVSLEAVDRDGSVSADPTMDPIRLRLAIDEMFRWMRASGMDMSEPLQIVSNCLRTSEKTRAKVMKLRPGLSPRPKPGTSVRLNTMLKPGEKVTMDKLKTAAQEVEATMNMMGAAAPRR